jgi:hypothetical protein
MSMPSERGVSSAATPPRTAMVACEVLAASAQRRRMATVGSSGQSLRTLFSR